MSKKAIDRKNQQLKVLLDCIFKDLEDFPSEILYNNQNGTWSVAQHLYHCYLVEKLSLSYILTKTKYPETLKEEGLLPSIKFLVLRLVLRLKIKLKAPQIAANFPDTVNLDDLYKKWTALRRAYGQLSSDLSLTILNQGIYKHPILGRLSLKLTLAFFEFHLKHHQKAIKRILH